MSKFNLNNGTPPPRPIDSASAPRVMPHTREELEKYRITYRSKIAKPEPLIYVRDSVVGARGDVVAISGPAKGGKTAICLNLIISALSSDDAQLDTLSIRVPFANDCPVIYIDTEQGAYTVSAMRQRICSALGVDREPDNLHLLTLREESKEDAFVIIMSYLEMYNNAHLVILDGIADLVGSVNDEADSVRVVREFMAKASKLKTVIAVVVHDTHANTTKSRGHLGSELERKAAGIIAVSTENGCKCIVPRKLRHAGDFEPVPFMWCNIKHTFISLDPSAIPIKAQDSAQNEALRIAAAKVLAIQCFSNGMASVRSGELRDMIKKIKRCGQSTAYKLIEELENSGFVTSVKDGNRTLYSLANDLMEELQASLSKQTSLELT